MIICYAHVSKDNQNLNRQIDQLKNIHVQKEIAQKLSSLFRRFKKETLLVESTSRLGRNTLDILNLIQELDQVQEQILFVSLKENMNTSTPTRKAMLQIMSVIAELKRNLLAN